MERHELERIRDSADSTAEEVRLAEIQLQRIYAAANPEVAQLDSLDVTALEGELLAASRKSSLAAVPYPDLHSFCGERKWNTESRELFERWTAVSPEAEATIKKAREILLKSFTDRFDFLLTELRTSLDAKQDITPLRNTIRMFCEDWRDSSVLDAETRKELVKLSLSVGGA